MKTLSSRRAYVALAVTLVTFATVAYAATFPYFQPATGILKGNANTYVTTAAVAGDITATFSGTCNSGTFMRGDGTCAAVPAGGVTSVGLTMPSGFSVSGSPVTSTGTLGVTTALNGVLAGNGSGFTTATSGNVIGLWTGTCNSGTFLRADGSCQAVSAGATGANPTASVGLTAVNGAAVTFMRSDAAPPLSQSIAPTWTGMHTFTGTETRKADDTAYISFFNSANTTRSGYLQINSATPSSIGTEVAQPFSIFTNNANRIRFDTDGSWDVAGSSPGSSGQVLTSQGAGSSPIWAASSGASLSGTNTWTGSNNFTAGLTTNGNFVYSTVNFASAKVFAAGTCSSPSNVTSCVRNSAGYYTITLTSGISSMKCIATLNTATNPPPLRTIATNTVNFSSVDVQVSDGSTRVDGDFYIICM